MKITKYEHACFTVEIDGKMLIVDPGDFTNMPSLPENVVAIVVTHEHPDHFDPHMLANLFEKNSDSIIVSLESITTKMPDYASQIVQPGDRITIAPFDLEFFGGKHAEIHSSIPLVDNIGVMVNDMLYYSGDSFALPNTPVSLLALPASGPWFKTSDAVDFMLKVQPKKVFATHNVHNSEPGQALFDRIVGGFAERAGISYTPLEVGESIEL
jgi:L-ascorbate metabolism protein UlaG (beta-lactamase superfamily)